MKRPGPRARALLTYLAVAAAGFLSAYIFVAKVMIPDDVAAADIATPGVVGLTQADAQRKLAQQGLKSSLGESRYSADAPKSTVLVQTPAAGTPVPGGTTVVLDISAGQQRSTMPSVLGISRDDATEELRKAGLLVGQVVEQPSDSARGIVLLSRPDAGQVVPAGTRVDLVVSGGPAEITLPDVAGRGLDAARGLLEQLGLTLAPIEYDSTSTLAAGTVVSQSPAAGTLAGAGATITLHVAGKP